MSKEAWHISAGSLSSYLSQIRTGEYNEGDLVAKAQFTLLRNSIIDENLIAEQFAAADLPEEQLADIISLHVSRYALFQTVAALETSVKIPPNALKPIAVDAYRKIKERSKDDFKHLETKAKYDAMQISNIVISELNELAQVISRVSAGDVSQADTAKVMELLPSPPSAETQAALKDYLKIRSRLEIGKYQPEIALIDGNNVIYDGQSPLTSKKKDDIAQYLTKTIVQQRIYVKTAKEDAKKIITQKLDPLIDGGFLKQPETDDNLIRLSTPAPDERHTFVLAGAPACGKGSIAAALAIKAKEHYGIDWDDTININTDEHRSIVSDSAGLGNDIRLMGTLNNIEASMIAEMAYDRVTDQTNANLSHHMVIDGVYPSKFRLNLAAANKGHVHVTCVSAPPDVSVERAYARGFKENRFIPTEYLMASHQAVSNDLLENVITTCKNNPKAELAIFDTDVPLEEQPKIALTLDFDTNTANVYNLESAANMHGKKNINVKARCAEDLYHDTPKADFGFIDELNRSGITVNLLEPNAQDTLRAHANIEHNAALK